MNLSITLSLSRLADLVPESKSNLSRCIRDILSDCYRRKMFVPPAGQAISGSDILPIYLTEKFAGLVDEHRGKLEGGKYVGLMVSAWLDQCGSGGRESDSNTPRASAPIKGARKIQKEILDAIVPPMNEEKIVICEAGTGTGKSRLMAWASTLVSRREGKCTVVAAPTIFNCIHLLQEFDKAGMSDDVAIGFGVTQYVDPNRLIGHLDTLAEDGQPHPAESDIRRWVNSGMPPQTLATRLLEKRIGLKGLKADLDEVCGYQDTPNIMLGYGGSVDHACESWRDELASGSKHILITTHAMLGSCVLHKSEVIEWFGNLFIDEAHDFEGNIAGLLQCDLPLSRLKSTLKLIGLKSNSKALHDAQACVENIWRCCSALPDGTSLNESSPDSAISRIKDEARQLYPLLKKVAALKSAQELDQERLISFQDWTQAVEQISSDRMSLFVTRSRVNKFPSLHSGMRSASGILTKIWDSVDSAALISGTLRLPLVGKLCYDYCASKLALPMARTHRCPAFHEAWSHQAEVFIQPTAMSYPRAEADAKSLAQWHHEAITLLSSIYAKARGGTLVLCNSYDDVETLSGLTQNWSKPPERLIHHVRGVSLNRQAELFGDAWASGSKPIWFACGSAWTGLDVSPGASVKADQDFLLTDVVILRLPFGTQRSTTQMSRANRIGFAAERSEALIVFRQGVGRLMRRPGLQNRRIWILDPRINEKHKVFREVLRKYIGGSDL